MNERSYTTPGWMAIVAAALTLPMIVLGLILDILARKNTGFAAAFLLPYSLVAGAQALCGVYALGRLKTLLNERHGFREVDGVIVAIIIGTCVMTLIGLSARVALIGLGVPKAAAIFFTVLVLTVGVPMAVLGIVFAVKMLRLNCDLGGLLKPFVYTTMAASICFATILLAPLGLLLDAASNVLLGIIFLRGGAPPPPEYV